MCRKARAADEEAKNDPNHVHVQTRNHRCQVRFFDLIQPYQSTTSYAEYGTVRGGFPAKFSATFLDRRGLGTRGCGLGRKKGKAIHGNANRR